MARPAMTLAERAARTREVLDRFEEKPFAWSGANCIRLAAAQAKALGHDVPPVPMFRTPLGAKKALAKRGAASVAELLDQFLPRHPAPAFARLGDLVVLPQDPSLPEGLQAVCIADGQGNVIGWHDGDLSRMHAIMGVAADVQAAWSVG